jgi:hypothetical protein
MDGFRVHDRFQALEPHAELSDLVAVEVFAKPEEYIVNEHMESDLGV